MSTTVRDSYHRRMVRLHKQVTEQTELLSYTSLTVMLDRARAMMDRCEDLQGNLLSAATSEGATESLHSAFAETTAVFKDIEDRVGAAQVRVGVPVSPSSSSSSLSSVPTKEGCVNPVCPATLGQGCMHQPTTTSDVQPIQSPCSSPVFVEESQASLVYPVAPGEGHMHQLRTTIVDDESSKFVSRQSSELLPPSSSSPDLSTQPNQVFQMEMNNASEEAHSPIHSGAHRHHLPSCRSLMSKATSHPFIFKKDSGRCFNCLILGHNASSCTSPRSCGKCGKRHHTLLHSQESSKPQQHSVSSSGSSVEAEPPPSHHLVFQSRLRFQNLKEKMQQAIDDVASKIAVLKSVKVNGGLPAVSTCPILANHSEENRDPVSAVFVEFESRTRESSGDCSTNQPSNCCLQESVRVTTVTTVSELEYSQPTHRNRVEPWPNLERLPLADPSCRLPVPGNVSPGTNHRHQVMSPDKAGNAAATAASSTVVESVPAIPSKFWEVEEPPNPHLLKRRNEPLVEPTSSNNHREAINCRSDMSKMSRQYQHFHGDLNPDSDPKKNPVAPAVESWPQTPVSSTDSANPKPCVEEPTELLQPKSPVASKVVQPHNQLVDNPWHCEEPSANAKQPCYAKWIFQSTQNAKSGQLGSISPVTAWSEQSLQGGRNFPLCEDAPPPTATAEISFSQMWKSAFRPIRHPVSKDEATPEFLQGIVSHSGLPATMEFQTPNTHPDYAVKPVIILRPVVVSGVNRPELVVHVRVLPVILCSSTRPPQRCCHLITAHRATKYAKCYPLVPVKEIPAVPVVDYWLQMKPPNSSALQQQQQHSKRHGPVFLERHPLVADHPVLVPGGNDVKFLPSSHSNPHGPFILPEFPERSSSRHSSQAVWKSSRSREPPWLRHQLTPPMKCW